MLVGVQLCHRSRQVHKRQCHSWQPSRRFSGWPLCGCRIGEARHPGPVAPGTPVGGERPAPVTPVEAECSGPSDSGRDAAPVVLISDSEPEVDAARAKRPRKQYQQYDSGQQSFDVQLVPGESKSKVEDRVFRTYCRQWMQKYDSELGMLSTAWRSGTDLRATCRCFEHDHCWNGKGTSFQFQATCTWSPDEKHVVLRLQVQVAGTCEHGTPRKVRADAQSDKPATVPGRRLVQRAVAHLAEKKESVTPTRVARHLGRSLEMNPDSVRYFARKSAQELGAQAVVDNRPRQQPVPVSREEWDELVEAHSDSAKSLWLWTVLPSGSFVGLVMPVLRELQVLHSGGFLPKIFLAGDATFDIEIDSWKYTCLTCAVHRRLSGRWRKSGLPVALCRHPKERPETYRLSLEAVHAEMQKLGLPPASQWHTDWAPGLGAAGRSVLPSIVHVPGMEHMIRNLNKKSLKTENGTRQAVPRLTARPLSVVSKYLYVIAGLPTLSLHVVALQVFLERVRVGWQEATWEQYFRKQYTYLARFVKADYGLEQATVGRWWFGMSSPLCHGHCSSQQQAEQSHKHLKRSLCDAKDRTVKEAASKGF